MPSSRTRSTARLARACPALQARVANPVAHRLAQGPFSLTLPLAPLRFLRRNMRKGSALWLFPTRRFSPPHPAVIRSGDSPNFLETSPRNFSIYSSNCGAGVTLRKTRRPPLPPSTRAPRAPRSPASGFQPSSQTTPSARLPDFPAPHR